MTDETKREAHSLPTEKGGTAYGADGERSHRGAQLPHLSALQDLHQQPQATGRASPS